MVHIEAFWSGTARNCIPKRIKVVVFTKLIKINGGRSYLAFWARLNPLERPYIMLDVGAKSQFSGVGSRMVGTMSETRRRNPTNFNRC